MTYSYKPVSRQVPAPRQQRRDPLIETIEQTDWARLADRSMPLPAGVEQNLERLINTLGSIVFEAR